MAHWDTTLSGKARPPTLTERFRPRPWSVLEGLITVVGPDSISAGHLLRLGLHRHAVAG
jgi:hypothetical protein